MGSEVGSGGVWGLTTGLGGRFEQDFVRPSTALQALRIGPRAQREGGKGKMIDVSICQLRQGEWGKTAPPQRSRVEAGGS
jgi:hypothetical protein